MQSLKQQLNKKKIILLFLSAVILTASPLIWNDLKSPESVIKNKIEIFAQQLPLYFMPGFSQRVIYLASELSLAVQELDFSTQELEGSLEECNCKYTQSYCPSGGSFNLVESSRKKILGSITSKVDDEMGKLKSRIEQEITDVISEKKREIEDKIDSKIDKKLDEIVSDINEALAEIGKKQPSEINKKINEINSQIDGLNSEVNSDIKKIETDAFEKVKEIESKAEGGIMEIREGILSETSEISFEAEKIKLAKEIELQWEVKNKDEIIKGQVLGSLAGEETEQLEEGLRLRIEKLNSKTNETISFINERSRKMEDNINSSGDTITEKLGVFGDILKTLSPCQPSPVGPFGSPCPEGVRKKIEEKQSEIKSKVAQISRLRELLEKETKNLKLDADKELRNNLDILLEESRKIIWFGEDVSNLYCNLNKCRAQCGLGLGVSFMGCLNPAEQKPIEIKFKGGVSLGNLSLGNVIIKDVNLGLPKTITTPKLGELPSFKIDLGELTINFPQVEVASLGERTTVDISRQPIVFNVPSPPAVSEAPLLELSCPNLNFPDYLPPRIELNSLEGELGKAESVENNWFFETFSWLMEKCQKIPEEITNGNVIFYEEALLPQICADLSYPCEGREEETLTRGEETTEASAEELAAAAEAAAAAAVAAAAKAEAAAAAAEAAPEEEKAAAVAAAETAAAEAAAAAETAVEAAAAAAPEEETATVEEEGCVTDPCVQMKKDCKDAKKKCDKDKSLAGTIIGFFTGDPCEKAENQCLAISRDLLLGVPDGKCYDATTTYTAIVNKCDALWQQYSRCTSIYRIIYHNTKACTLPAICQSLGSPDKREVAQKTQCQKLFQKQGEAVPQNCNLAVLQDKCAQLKEQYAELIETSTSTSEAENLPEVPEPCKFLPLFTGEFSLPKEYESPEYSAPSLPTSQKIFNFPASLPNCSSSYPTVLKISFPKVKIRDINLPHISLRIGSWSLVDIKLPSFKFEDLVIPDWEICNLNDCAFNFPDFKFQLPHLDIPEIKIPPVSLGELNIDIGAGVTVVVPLPDVELSGIQYSVTPFKFSKLPNLGNLIAPKVEYDWPGMPRLKTTFKFSGIDFNYDWANFLGTLLKQILAWFEVDVSGCISYSQHFALPGLSFVLEDYNFSWPDFPALPGISACQDINKFCGNMKSGLQQVSDKIGEIEKTINQVVSQKQVIASKGPYRVRNGILQKYTESSTWVDVNYGGIYVTGAYVINDGSVQGTIKGELIKITGQAKAADGDKAKAEITEKSIQTELNLAAQEINEELSQSIEEQLNQRRDEIIKAIEDHINKNYQIGICMKGEIVSTGPYRVKNGILQKYSDEKYTWVDVDYGGIYVSGVYVVNDGSVQGTIKGELIKITGQAKTADGDKAKAETIIQSIQKKLE